jgi:dihydrofolate reductase
MFGSYLCLILIIKQIQIEIMKNIIYIAVSLDGYIASEDGGIEWLMDIPNPDGSDYGFGEFMEAIDAVVMGRNTFEQVLTFGQWPYNKTVFVLSNSLKTIPVELQGKVEILRGDPNTIVDQLNSRDYNNLYIDGGKTIQKFLQHNLIDELIISTIPILLGKGIPLFKKIENEQKYEHVKTEVYQNTIVKSHYRKIIPG